MTRAVILAAGQGTRLRPLTNDIPKCLVDLAGKPLLDRQIGVFHRCGITDISVVAGYRADKIAGRPVDILLNPDYDRTNMVATLFCARSLMDGRDDLIISYGDIVFEPRVLKALLDADAPMAVVADAEWRRYWARRMPDPLADAETFRMRPDGTIWELGKKAKDYSEIEAQYIGLIKIRKDALPAFVKHYDGLDRSARFDGKDFPNMYMTSLVQSCADIWPVRAVLVENGWLETDTVEDHNLYEAMRADGSLSSFYDALA